MDERVIISLEGGVADVRLARGDKLNALDPAMFDALIAVGERLKGEAGLRCVVLSGEGRGFCAGLDMASFAGGLEADGLLPKTRTPAGANRFQQVVMTWREVPVPVIAAIHGVCFGGGLQIALGADIRLVAPDARLSVMEIKWGIVPDMAGTALLRGLVRDDVARELIWTGRTVDGQEAAAIGLATRVSADPRGEALALAAEIAARNPAAIRAGKRLMNLAADADAPSLLLAESEEQHALLGSPNQREAVMANLQKRAPKFTD